METQNQCQVFNLPLEPFETLSCEVSFVLWLACSVSVGSLRLSWIMFSKQVSALTAECAEDVALVCTVLLVLAERGPDTLDGVFKELGSPDLPNRWGTFSVAFRWDLSVESTWLFNTSWCLEDLKFLSLVLKRVLDIFVSGWLVLLPRCVRGPLRGCWFSLVALELLGWEKLNGTGLVHGFFFLAFPCSKWM